YSSIQARVEDNRIRSECEQAAATRGRGRQQALGDCVMQVSARIDEQWALERDLLEAMRLTMTSLAGIEGKKAMIVAGAHLPEMPGLDLYEFLNQIVGGGMHPVMQASHRSQRLSIA